MKNKEILQILKRNYDNATLILRLNEIDGEVIVFPSMFEQFNTIKTELDKLDRIKEVVENAESYDYDNTFLTEALRQIIEGVE